MAENGLKKLQNQIWVTRISRVNAEKRLLNKEKFFQGINIYYSCILIIFSILSLEQKYARLNMLTIFMTISLLITILYVNGQNYSEHARDFRNNYTNIQILEFRANHLNESDKEEIMKIEEEYCRLLNVAENHISFDYYCAVCHSKPDYKKGIWRGVKWKYYLNCIWRILLVFVLISLPIILFILVMN